MNNKLRNSSFNDFSFFCFDDIYQDYMFIPELDINKEENTKKENVWREVFNPGANPTKMMGKKDTMDIVNDPKQDSSIWDYLINSEESKQKIENFKKSTKEGPY